MKRLPSPLHSSVELGTQSRERPKNCRRSSRLSKGMSNPESRSSQPARRRSNRRPLSLLQPWSPCMDDPESRSSRRRYYQRLFLSLGQPKWSQSPPKTCESKIPVDDSIDMSLAYRNAYEKAYRMVKVPADDLVKVPADELVIDFAASERYSRRIDAEDFRSSYTYGCNNNMEQKTCIWSSGTHTWLEKSSGIMWVAVHGMNSICVVTRNEALDVTRLGDFLKTITKQDVLKLFRETVVSEMEDLVDPSSEARQKIHQSFDKPFAVVSLIPAGTNKANEESGPEASGAVYDEKRAINFLMEKMESGSTFTYNETVQTAISAFQLLFHKEMKAKDIQVQVWAEDDFARDLWIRDSGENILVLNRPGFEILVERLPK